MQVWEALPQDSVATDKYEAKTQYTIGSLTISPLFVKLIVTRYKFYICLTIELVLYMGGNSLLVKVAIRGN